MANDKEAETEKSNLDTEKKIKEERQSCLFCRISEIVYVCYK